MNFNYTHNTFTAIHNTDIENIWCGPNTWRTIGEGWCYEYKLKEIGILASSIKELFE